jgi:tetratricopeptide (TPR) repeat protein/SAM-dependent methyltransferase
MNRKQRRASGRAHAAPGAAANSTPSGALADLFAAAVAQHQAGALVEAERRYRYILTLFPGHSDSLHNLGLIALHGGNATAAVDLIGKAIAINDRIAEYHYNIALAYRALNHMDDVTAHLERAIGLRSDHALAHLNLGNVRGEQGRLSDAVACYERALALRPNLAPARFNLANALSQQGRWDAAIACFQQALALEPNHAETHARLGAALLAQSRTDEAIAHLKRALALKPNLLGAIDDIGKAYLSAGKPELALYPASRALELSETEQRKAFFAYCARFVRFTEDDERYRKLVLRALAEGWARPRALTGVCVSLIKLNSGVKDGIARANAAWPARLPAAELLGSSAMAELSHDELPRCLLECDPVTDIGLERLLTNVRYAMLASATDGACDESVLGFYCAVARQCFVNEYVFSTTEPEAEQAQRLRASLEQTLAAGAPCSPLWPVVVGAYFPLHSLSKAEALLDRSWPQSVAAVIVQQVKEPAEERRIAATIPVLTIIDGEVSRAVRQQYEESPYPRWVRVGPPQQPAFLNDRQPERVPDILIAGCGTGLSTIEFAQQVRHARVVAIDLSLASLSYAKRMSGIFSLTNIEFAQADIMGLGSIGRQFDFIDASGVLHHLADPWEGWRVLLSLLRPGAVMQVGLYSELARQNIVAARALIAERNYRPIAEDIRRCREHIIASDDPLLKSVTNCEDFYTTNECRDLLFHVQEHRITLPAIKSFLAANNMKFAGFNLDAPTLHRFATRFPEPAAMTDLDCWHSFETEAPGTFIAMYQFWVHKPGPDSDRPTAHLN